MAQQEGRKEGKALVNPSIQSASSFQMLLNRYLLFRMSPKSICILLMLSMLVTASANISIAGTGFHQISPHGTPAPLPLLRETTYTLAPAATQ